MLVDTTDVSEGDHNLVLESFDQNGAVMSTLKTDSVTIRVVAEVEIEVPHSFFPAGFEVAILVANKPSDWTLPEVDPGNNEVFGLEISAETPLAGSITFKSSTWTVNFSGEGFELL